MSIDEQLVWIGRWQYFHQDTEALTALESIKLTLKDYKRLIEEVAQPVQEEAKGMYRAFVRAYDTFCRMKTKAGAKMDGANGKALKTIIAFLTQEASSKDEAGALEAWMYILLNWDKLTPFIQNQVSLLQINKNLPEILMQLRRNGKTTGEQAASNIREGIRAGRGDLNESDQ